MFFVLFCFVFFKEKLHLTESLSLKVLKSMLAERDDSYQFPAVVNFLKTFLKSNVIFVNTRSSICLTLSFLKILALMF